jgi:hypothetical protein
VAVESVLLNSSNLVNYFVVTCSGAKTEPPSLHIIYSGPPQGLELFFQRRRWFDLVLCWSKSDVLSRL